MKKTLLYKVAYLVEAEDGEISTNHGKEELRKMIWKALPDQDIAIDRVHTAQWCSTQELLLDPGTIERMDCRYCILSHAEPLTKQELLGYLGMDNGQGEAGSNQGTDQRRGGGR